MLERYVRCFVLDPPAGRARCEGCSEWTEKNEAEILGIHGMDVSLCVDCANRLNDIWEALCAAPGLAAERFLGDLVDELKEQMNVDANKAKRQLRALR